VWVHRVHKITYQDQKAMKKPIHEKKKTRPYLLTGLKTGIDLAFLLYGLRSGAAQSLFTAKPIVKIRGSDAAASCGETRVSCWR
jgi:hypothetical protein